MVFSPDFSTLLAVDLSENNIMLWLSFLSLACTAFSAFQPALAQDAKFSPSTVMSGLDALKFPSISPHARLVRRARKRGSRREAFQVAGFFIRESTPPHELLDRHARAATDLDHWERAAARLRAVLHSPPHEIQRKLQQRPWGREGLTIRTAGLLKRVQDWQLEASTLATLREWHEAQNLAQQRTWELQRLEALMQRKGVPVPPRSLATSIN